MRDADFDTILVPCGADWVPEADTAPSPDASRRRSVIGSLAFIAVILDFVPVAGPWVLGLVSVAALSAALFGMKKYRPKPAWPWAMVVVALSLFVVEGVLRVRFNTLGNLTVHRNLDPDFLSLIGYALLMVALYGFLISRPHAKRRRFGVFYDGGIAALALLAVSWVFLIEPILGRSGTPNSVRIILVSYPAIAAFLLVANFQIAFSPGHQRSESERLVFISLVWLFVGDIFQLCAELHLVASAHVLVNIPFIVSYAAVTAAMLEPSMKTLFTPRLEGSEPWNPTRVVLVAIGLGTPSLLFLRLQNENFDTRLGLFITVMLLSGIAILQIVRALYDVERSESRLQHQAMHDALTGLPNRRYLERYLERALEGLSLEGEEKIGVLFLDLDRFKLINDTLGHAQGDALLVEVARRLQASVRPDDLVTRIGGDEFVVVLGEVVSVESASEFANQIRRTFREPFNVAEVEFVISASIGLAFAQPNQGARARVGFNEVEILLREADTAMYQAKDGGRDSIAVYEESMRTSVLERVELERDLRHAVRRGELQLVFQPIVEMKDHQVLGMEALVRWSHPTFGVLLPSRFIHLAEETELINELGIWVLNEALRVLAESRKTPGMEHLTVSVNLSVNQLRDELLVQRVTHMLAIHGLSASSLCLELTESEIIRDPECAIKTLNALRELGITLAVDDFGTQYSSLSYLQRLPFDVLKIDRSFVEPLSEENTVSESLVAAIVVMANALGIRTVVEGVETMDQARRLRAVGCSVAQGYLYARPARIDQLPHVLNLLSVRRSGATLDQVSSDEVRDSVELVSLRHGA
ncbi:MAG TPA: EAL domain-containing protein [Acidimicrobiales bacterium]|nr:EAL domain-containing protein [Acidimicrobiales bacterium]